MSRAAEQALPEAKNLLASAVSKMTISDARDILTGGNQAATAFFKRTTEPALGAKFEPIVKQQVDKIGLAQSYDNLAGRAAAVGLISGQQASISAYVTQKALDGLHLMMGREEQPIRAQQSGRLVSMVFGALK